MAGRGGGGGCDVGEWETGSFAAGIWEEIDRKKFIKTAAVQLKEVGIIEQTDA